MKILALDSSAVSASAAVLDDDKVFSSSSRKLTEKSLKIWKK